MYVISNNDTINNWYNDAIFNPNRRLLVEFYINGNLIDNSYLLDKIEIEHDCMSEGYTIGQIIYPKLTFSLYKDITVFENIDVSIFISLEVFNTSTNKNDWIRVPMGNFKVIEIEESRLQKRCTGYCQHYKQLQFPFIKSKNQYTSTELLAQITEETGIEFEGFPNVTLMNEDIVTKTQNEDGTETEESREGENFNNHSYASIIALVAGACGGNAIFSREGKIKLVQGTPRTNVGIIGDLVSDSTTIKPTTYSKNTLQVVKRSDIADIKVGDGISGTQVLVIQNPLMSQETATTALSHISTVSYQPISTKFLCPLHLEPLDSIKLYVDGEEYILPLQKYKLVFTGNSLSAEVESFVPTEVQDGYKGSLTTQIGDLQGQVNAISSLVVGSLVVGNLEALEIKVDQLQANIIKVNQMIANGITADMIQSYNLTSKNTTIQDALIKDAMIANISADKIHAGTINTNNIKISSNDGSMILQGNIQQFIDKNGKVRIQIGKDATDKFTFILYDETGKGVLINQDGIQNSDAIKDGLIADTHIADDANVDAKKLDISSLFSVINEDNSHTIKASQVLLDTEQQTLEISFNEMTTKQELLTEKTNTLTTQLNTQQGQIDTLIKNTTITDDGQTTTLKDAYSQFVQTQNGFNLKVEEHESKFNNLKIGTRNYLANTGTPFTMTGNNTTNQTSTMYHFVNKDNSPIIGGEATFAFKYKIEEGATGAVRIQTNGAKTGDATEGKWFNLYRNDNITTMENEGQVVYTRTYNESDLNTFTGVSIRLDNFVGSITVSECSMVVGNEFGGWQPAPEDTGEALSSLEVRVSSAEQKITKDAIISTVSDTYVTKIDFENLSIGANNLIPNSNFDYELLKWSGHEYFYLNDYNELAYSQTGLTTDVYAEFYTDAIDVSEHTGKELVLTFDYKIKDKSKLGGSSILYARFFNNSTSTSQEDAISYQIIYPAKDYKNNTYAKSETVITTVPTNATHVRIIPRIARNCEIVYRKFQLEVGNVATDYKPSLSDITLYADNSNDILQNELNDLKNIADLSNNADAISPDMKTKLISEGEDAESVYNKLVYMYQDVMGSPIEYKSIFTNMKNSYSTLSSEVAYLKSSQNEISNSGLGDILQLFNNFYTFAEELNEEILNSLKGITDSLSTEIEQLAESVTIKVNQFSSELDSISTHFIFDTNGLTIKSSADSTKYIKLDNDSLDFMDNNTKVAEITNQQLNISKAEIKSDMKIGNMKIKPSGSSKNGVIFVFE